MGRPRALALLSCCLVLLLSSCSRARSIASAASAAERYKKQAAEQIAQLKQPGAIPLWPGIEERSAGIFAVFQSNLGQFVVKLAFREAPLSAINFIGAAEGIKPFSPSSQPIYNGISLQRSGQGEYFYAALPKDERQLPSYQVQQDFHPSLDFSSPGTLAMLKQDGDGPYSDPYAFILTTRDLNTELEGRLSPFGRVVEGLDIVLQSPETLQIIAVKIGRLGAEAKTFSATWQHYQEALSTYYRNRPFFAGIYHKLAQDFITTHWPRFPKALEQDPNYPGIEYKILKKGQGQAAGQRDVYRVSYRMWASQADGQSLFIDASSLNEENSQPEDLSAGKLLTGWAQSLAQMKKGEQRLVLIPPELGYGIMGLAPYIPKWGYLVIEMELFDFQ